MVIYLAGKIDVTDEVTLNFREKLAKIFDERGIITRDPLRKKPTELFGTYTPNEIVFRDLDDINKSDLVLAVVNRRGDKISFGTPCEVMYAWLQRKPVVFVSNDAELRDHPWVRGLCVKVFDNVPDAIKYILEFWQFDDNVNTTS